jgi:NosR/NirI family transcriptional regulator, nitrous oxide reductase regulator
MEKNVTMKIPFLYFDWLQKDNPAGDVERLPELTDRFETSVPGLSCIGDLTGIPLIKLAAESGRRFVERLSLDQRFQQERGLNIDRDCLDLIIVGAGPSGVAASLSAMEQGLNHLLFESSRPFNTIANFPTGKPIYVTPAGPMKSPLTFTDGTKETLLTQLREGLTAAAGKKLPLREGEMVTGIKKLPDHFVVTTARSSYRALRVVVAIGKTGATRALAVPGERLPKVFTRVIDPGEYTGKDILVVGGGDSAVEAAIALAKNGNRVTLSYRKAALGRPKARILGVFNELARKGSIMPVFQSSVKEIRESEVVLSTGTGETVVPNSVVYVLIGSDPPIDFLKRAGIRLHGEKRLSDGVALAAFLFFASMLYFGKKAPMTVITGFIDFARLPWSLGHWALPDRISCVAAWTGFLGCTLLGSFLAIHAIKNAGRYFSSAWNRFQYGFYFLTAMVFCFLYVWYKLLGQRAVFGDMGDWYTLMFTLTVAIFGLRRIFGKPTGYIKRQTAALVAIQALPLFLLPLFVLPYLGAHHFLPAWVAHNVFPGGSYWRAFGLVLAWPLFIYNAASGTPALFWLVLGAVQTFAIIPVIVYKWGKGAYCGWICSCGAMAETLGDAYRTRALHGRAAKRAENAGQLVLWFAVLVTVLSIIAWAMGGRAPAFALNAYGLFVDVVLAGTIGLGAYFSFSGRTWCRFFCPLAALMHIYARFSAYRIMANKNRCISCNICTKVCHMGIDVMNYANKGVPMNDVQCVRCSACIVNCPLHVLTFGSIGAVDLDNKIYKRNSFPLAQGWKSGLSKKDITMLLLEEKRQGPHRALTNDILTDPP